jgi:hypothetical protein
MSITKHKIFKIEIKNSLSIEDAALNELDLFLQNSNHIYVNHTNSILTDDVPKYGQIITENRFLVISLIYKDLNNTPLNLKQTGEKLKKIVTKEVKSNENIKTPDVVTDFDKDFQKTLEKIEKSQSGF